MCLCLLLAGLERTTRSLSSYAGLEVDSNNEAFKTRLENLNQPPGRGDAGGDLFRPESLDKLKHSVFACRPGT